MSSIDLALIYVSISFPNPWVYFEFDIYTVQYNTVIKTLHEKNRFLSFRMNFKALCTLKTLRVWLLF